MIEETINERMIEVYNKLKEDMDRRFAALEENLAQRNIDEKAIRYLVRAVVGSEVAKMYSIVMEEIARVEEKLKKHGVDAELVRKLIDEIYGKVLDDVKRILDQRIAHIISVIDEQGNEVRDALDLINEILRSEIEIGEKIEELRNMLSEEKIEELLYKALMKHGVIKRRRRKWTPLIAGLGVLIAIVVGLLVNPIATLVILFIVFVILMRW